MLTYLESSAEILCFLQCQSLRIIRKILGRHSVNNVETHIKKFAFLLSFLNTQLNQTENVRPECPYL